MTRPWRFIPLLLLALLVSGLVWRLASPVDNQVGSKLAGQPVPAFALGAAVPGKPGLSSSDLAAGGAHLVNIFASWCVPCVTEAPVLARLKARGVAIQGIAIRDRPEDIARFLARHGDPFERIGSDSRSEVQIALGSSGVPESFIVDGRGVIRYQHIGPIDEADIPLILAKLEEAK
ncbi:MAG: DsbE family thiol:disulfide interchange protein [Sphingomicrobium sp.]